MDNDELAAAFQEQRGRDRDRRLTLWLRTLSLDDRLYLIGMAAQLSGEQLGMTEGQVLQRCATLAFMQESQGAN